jgi:hypothetical protein
MIVIKVPNSLVKIFFSIRAFLKQTPIIKTEEQIQREFCFHFDLANKRDMREFIEKCSDTQQMSIGEEKFCKCHKEIFILDRTGKEVHRLQMTDHQALWFKDNLEYVIPMKLR